MIPRNLIIGIVVAAVVVVALAVVYVGANSSHVVAAGDNVSVYYTGTLANGTVFGSNVGGTPLNFTAGSSQVIQGFDNAVIGMKVGQNKTVTIPPSEAYGAVNQSLIINVPISDFGNQTVQTGMTVASNYNGTSARGFIKAVNSTTVIVDYNSPLAGQTLTFKIEVVGIRR